MLNLWTFTKFNAQRGIIVDVQVGVMKIYVVVVEAHRKKRKTRWDSGTIKIDGFFSFTPLEC
jgi:hypothetical protein